jgi:hypothetical protein
MTDDLIRAHVRAVLEGWSAAMERQLAALEAQGYRIVDGGPLADEWENSGWRYTDWRTGAVLAEGCGVEAMEDEVRRLDPDRRWFPVDRIDGETGVVTPGVPESLCQALTDWAESPLTPVEDVAAWSGLTLERVTRFRNGE